ncbi:unnamed protein product [Amoebophrya sp. A25]|nr:unnamed protein product [Amoebophrya sp. A25]|eukprot:GSA25T00007629001.1
MGRLIEDLIRKRAEHNDGILPDLEEISLHQEEIEKIECLEQCCRHLKILLLQHNCIAKLENLSKLKELEYLNVSLNNISKIENLDGCESLKKLDMTLNFVDMDVLKESLESLQGLEFLEDLYLLGNPCADFVGYRQYVTAKLPQLQQLDGHLINPQDRITALQELPVWEKALAEKARDVIIDKAHKAATGYVPPETAHAPETRLSMAREMGKQKAEKEMHERRRMGTEPKEAREIPGAYTARGDIRQCNEGKYVFRMEEIGNEVVFELETPKHLETGLIDVDVNPWYVRVICREKLTQLKLPEEVNVCETSVQRSKTSGFLKIRMLKAAGATVGANRLEPAEHDKRTFEPTSSSSKPGEGSLVALQPENEDVEEDEPRIDASSHGGGKNNGSEKGPTRDRTSLVDTGAGNAGGSTKKKKKYPSNLSLFDLHRDPIQRSGDRSPGLSTPAEDGGGKKQGLVQEVG